ncbi:MAG: CHC2 zinc finger domain-containing protein [Candidatus Uhrbacteria bacterium]
MYRIKNKTRFLAIKGYIKYVKTHVSVVGVAQKLGFHPNRQNYIRCPLHEVGRPRDMEATASLHLYAERGIWHCFGCGAHGDAFGLVKKHLGSQSAAFKFFRKHFHILPPYRAPKMYAKLCQR